MGLRYQLARIEEALPFFVVDDFRFPQKPPLTACSLDRETQTETEGEIWASVDARPGAWEQQTQAGETSPWQALGQCPASVGQKQPSTRPRR